MPRRITFFGSDPRIMKPPMSALSPGCTRSLVDRFNNWAATLISALAVFALTNPWESLTVKGSEEPATMLVSG